MKETFMRHFKIYFKTLEDLLSPNPHWVDWVDSSLRWYLTDLLLLKKSVLWDYQFESISESTKVCARFKRRNLSILNWFCLDAKKKKQRTTKAVLY